MKELKIEKLYYSISEVSKIAEIEPHILRYWEKEFDELKPKKGDNGVRLYTNKDINLVLTIKKLIKEEKYTIKGAKEILKNYLDADNNLLSSYRENKIKQEQLDLSEKVSSLSDDLKKSLIEIRNILSSVLEQTSERGAAR